MSTCRVNVDTQDCLRCVSSVSEPEDDWLRLGPGSLSKVWADPRRAGESRASEEVPVSFHRSPSPHSGSGPQPRLRLRPIASSGWAPTLGAGQTLRHDTNNIIYIRHHLKPIIRINIKHKYQYHNKYGCWSPECAECRVRGEAGTWHAATQAGQRGAIPPPAQLGQGQVW